MSCLRASCLVQAFVGFLGALLFLGFAYPCIAQESFKDLEKAARDGNAAAAYKLGFLYAVGDDSLKIKANLTTAISYYKKAADAGIVEAQYKLAFIYEKGPLHFKGATKNDVLAVKYYKLAAAGGNAEAKLALAHCYQAGMGGLVDDKSSEQIRLVQEAAQMGLTAAQAELALFYQIGKGDLARDPVLAMAWASVAAAQGDRRGIATCDDMIKLYHLSKPDLEKAARQAEKMQLDIAANLARGNK